MDENETMIVTGVDLARGGLGDQTVLGYYEVGLAGAVQLIGMTRFTGPWPDWLCREAADDIQGDFRGVQGRTGST